MKSDIAMEIVTTLLHLRELVSRADERIYRNGQTVSQLDGARCDLAHQLEQADGDMLMTAQLGMRYGEISRARRKLKNENRVLEWITLDEDFAQSVNRLLEGMTGEMQFEEHAVYHPSECCGVCYWAVG